MHDLQIVRLISESGGEGIINEVVGPGAQRMALKRYKPQVLADHGNRTEQKLRAMVDNPPTDPSTIPGHRTFVWPRALVYDHGRFVGFCMPLLVGKWRTLLEIVDRRSRREAGLLEWHWGSIVTVCRNLATAVDSLHDARVYWGDLNEENVVVTGKGLVTLIDLDTAAFRVGNSFYPGSGYVRDDWRPPEYSSSICPFTAEGDRWALAVEIYVLLMESYRPFACADYVGLAPADYVKRGLSPLLDNSLRLPKGSPPLDVLPPSLHRLLCKCFGEGREHPTLRPPPAHYVKVLTETIARLIRCPDDPGHVWAEPRQTCPWCERSRSAAATQPRATPKAFPSSRPPSPPWVPPARLPAGAPPSPVTPTIPKKPQLPWLPLLLFAVAVAGVALYEPEKNPENRPEFPAAPKANLQPSSTPPKSQVCTFSGTTDKVATNETLYAASYGGRARKRSDITITSRNTKIELHLILDSKVAYLWGNTGKGFKLPAQEESIAEILGRDKHMNVKCRDWTPNNSVFQIPTNIKFTEITKGNALSLLGENSITNLPKSSQTKSSPQSITKEKTPSNRNPFSAGHERKRIQQEHERARQDAEADSLNMLLGNMLLDNFNRSQIQQILEYKKTGTYASWKAGGKTMGIKITRTDTSGSSPCREFIALLEEPRGKSVKAKKGATACRGINGVWRW